MKKRGIKSGKSSGASTSPLSTALTESSTYLPRFTAEEEQQLSKIYDKTRYGPDSESPLLWALNKVHGNYTDTFEYFLKHDLLWNYQGDDYIQAFFEGWRRYQAKEERSADLDLIPPAMFYRLATLAVRRLDYRFFEEVGRLLHERVQPLQKDLVAQAVLSAYKALKQPSAYPTKKEVREKAIISWATWQLILRMPRPWDGIMPAENKVREHSLLMPEQNWTQVFKRCGLSHLPNDKGGQPSHGKTNKSYSR